MEELIARIAAAIGVEAGVAKAAVGHVLAFLQQEFPEGPVAELLEKLPGAQETMAAASSGENGGGNGGGLGGVLGGLMGGGLMGLAGKLNGIGLDMGQIQTLAREILAHAEGLIGKENVQKIASSIPGLSQFL